MWQFKGENVLSETTFCDYGCFLYGSATNIRLKKLDRIQYKALRLVLGALKSTPPRAGLLVLHRAPPQVADRGKPPRYGWYRGNEILGADQN